MSTVALAVIDGLHMMGVTAAYEVFGRPRPELADSWYEFNVCGPDGARIGDWFLARPTHGLDALAEADTVIVPSGRPTEPLLDAVRAAYENGARLVSICTGAFTLAEAGLLDGRSATTHWQHAEALAKRYPKVRVEPDVLYLRDGPIFTSAGNAAGIDLCLHLVRLDHGAAVANEIARYLVVPPHRSGGQAQFINTPMPESPNDAVLGELLSWVLERLDQPLTVADLARRVNMSPRTLARHFNAVTGVSPLRWLLTQRMHRAQELLETSGQSIEQVAARTGMGTATTLRRHFQRVLGVSPDSYRRTFLREAGSSQASVSTASKATTPSSTAGVVTAASAASGNGMTNPT